MAKIRKHLPLGCMSCQTSCAGGPLVRLRPQTHLPDELIIRKNNNLTQGQQRQQ